MHTRGVYYAYELYMMYSMYAKYVYAHELLQSSNMHIDTTRNIIIHTTTRSQYSTQSSQSMHKYHPYCKLYMQDLQLSTTPLSDASKIRKIPMSAKYIILLESTIQSIYSTSSYQSSIIIQYAYYSYIHKCMFMLRTSSYSMHSMHTTYINACTVCSYA